MSSVNLDFIMLNSSDTVNRTLTMNFSDLNETNETFHSNSSVITCNSQDILSYDPLFHIACVIFLVSYLLPTSLLWAKMSYHSGIKIIREAIQKKENI